MRRLFRRSAWPDPTGLGRQSHGGDNGFDVAEVRRIYETHLGPPSREATFVDHDRAVEVLKWTPRSSTAGEFLYVTLGASRVSSGAGGHRIEYYIGFQDERDDIATILAEMAADPVRDGVLVDEGQTLTFPRPLWKGSRFRTLLVFWSGRPAIPESTLADGSHLSMRGLAPLHASELAAKKRIGYEELWAQFAATKVPLGDPNRPPTALREG